jgi:hypothetical protein
MNLRPDGAPVKVGSVTLRTPGLQGEAVAHAGGMLQTRAAAGTTEELESALSRQNITQLDSIEIAKAHEIPTGPAVTTRSTRFDEPARWSWRPTRRG